MIRVNDLRKKYEKFDLDCSLNIPKGYVTGLIGVNGSGKTTTFKAILGLIQKDSGEITILDKNIDYFNSSDKQDIGVVLSDSGFSGYLTITNVSDILNSFYRNFNKALFYQLCEKYDLPINKKLNEFSLGMKAVFKVIAAVSHDPKLLILDEPTAGLDIINREAVLDLLREYMEFEDNSILISSHNSKDLESICDYIYMIKNGKIIFHESTDSLLSDYAVIKMKDDQISEFEQEYIIFKKRESYGYKYLTNQKQFYLENFPQVVIENGNIDDLLMIMNMGESL